MKKYYLEGKILDGKHKGETFILIKGGYVKDDVSLLSTYECYDTKRAAQMVASKYNKKNKFDSVSCRYIEPCEYTVKEIEFKGGD